MATPLISRDQRHRGPKSLFIYLTPIVPQGGLWPISLYPHIGETIDPTSYESPLGPPFEKGGMAGDHYMPPATPTKAALSLDFNPWYVLAA